MTYAQGRACYGADSHVMELGDWLVRYADADVRERFYTANLAETMGG